tara:strand:- start:1323 stop:1535 length:213 start_codon:yes stop_codon:yes gene_type:complete
MNTLKALKNFVNNFNNDLQGFNRTLIVNNLETIEREMSKKERLLEMVLEDLEDGQLTQTVINKIKNNLTK